MLIFAATIALSRVVITAHFVSDVVAAAFVGSFGAILVRNWYASRGLAFVPGSTARCMPVGALMAPHQVGCPGAVGQ